MCTCSVRGLQHPSEKFKARYFSKKREEIVQRNSAEDIITKLESGSMEAAPALAERFGNLSPESSDYSGFGDSRPGSTDANWRKSILEDTIEESSETPAASKMSDSLRKDSYIDGDTLQIPPLPKDKKESDDTSFGFGSDIDGAGDESVSAEPITKPTARVNFAEDTAPPPSPGIVSMGTTGDDSEDGVLVPMLRKSQRKSKKRRASINRGSIKPESDKPRARRQSRFFKTKAPEESAPPAKGPTRRGSIIQRVFGARKVTDSDVDSDADSDGDNLDGFDMDEDTANFFKALGGNREQREKEAEVRRLDLKREYSEQKAKEDREREEELRRIAEQAKIEQAEADRKQSHGLDEARGRLEDLTFDFTFG